MLKKIISGAVLALASLAAHAIPYDILLSQKNLDGEFPIYYSNFLSEPASLAVIGYDPVTHVPQYFILGSGITCTGTPYVCSVAAAGAPAWGDITGKPLTFAPSPHTHLVADLSDSQAPGRALLVASTNALARAAIGAGTSSFDGAYSSLSGIPATFAPAAHNQAFSTITGTPTTLAGYGITDAATSASVAAGYYPLSGNPSGFLTGITSSQVTAALGFTPYNSTNPSAYVNQTGARGAISLTTTGSGAATYNAGTGVLNVPTPAAAAAFNYGAPAAKTVTVSTAYQAADPSKAAVVTLSPACTNATTVLAASACTMQIRQGSAGLTCSTGTVVSTWSSTIALGLVITQGNGFPVDIKLPIGGYFIVCPSAGTFTLSAVEQTAG